MISIWAKKKGVGATFYLAEAIDQNKSLSRNGKWAILRFLSLSSVHRARTGVCHFSGVVTNRHDTDNFGSGRVFFVIGLGTSIMGWIKMGYLQSMYLMQIVICQKLQISFLIQNFSKSTRKIELPKQKNLTQGDYVRIVFFFLIETS